MSQKEEIKKYLKKNKAESKEIQAKTKEIKNNKTILK